MCTLDRGPADCCKEMKETRKQFVEWAIKTAGQDWIALYTYSNFGLVHEYNIWGLFFFLYEGCFVFEGS